MHRELGKWWAKIGALALTLGRAHVCSPHKVFFYLEFSPLQGAALATMVGLLTFGKRKYESLDGTMRTAIAPLHTAMQDMLTMVDRDTEAFTDYMASTPSLHTLVEC